MIWQEPLLMRLSTRLRAIPEATGGIGAVRGIETLNLNPTQAAVEEHSPISVHHGLHPNLEFEGAGEFSPRLREAILSLPREHFVFHLPVGVSLFSHGLHARSE